MKRRMTMLVAVAAVSGVMTLFSPSATPPVQAAQVCAGQGSAQTNSSFHYPVIGENSTAGVSTGTFRSTLTPRSGDFIFHMFLGTCLPSLTAISASGTIHGWCGLSVGSGTTSFGYPFHWVGVGDVLVITGGVTGVANFEANVLDGDSCSHSPGANDFLVTGASIDTNCTITPIGTSSSIASIPIPTNNLSTSVLVGFMRTHVTTGGHLSMQYTACVGI